MIVHKSTIDSTGFDSCIGLKIGIIIDPRWLVGLTPRSLEVILDSLIAYKCNWYDQGYLPFLPEIACWANDELKTHLIFNSFF